MTELGIDYSDARPDPAAIVSSGYKFVARYISPEPAKNLTNTEAAALHAAGLGIVLVWEDGAQNALGGAAQGALDGKQAATQLNALGYPLGAPVFFAVDFDAQPAQFIAIEAYADAFVAQLPGRVVGIYGGVNVVSTIVGSHGVTVGWQTEAWSGSTVSAKASLYQRISPTLPAIPGGGYDENALLLPLALWESAEQPAAPPKPAPVSAPAPPRAPDHAHANTFTPLTVDGVFGPDTVKALQYDLYVSPDGLWGPVSRRALQAHLGVLQDGVIGPVTVRALQTRVRVPADGNWGAQTTRALQTQLNAGTF